jgi:ABC-2 type transport system permease protein
MSTPAAPPAEAAPLTSASQPFYWSVRRELWESRSVPVAPLAVAGLVLFATLIRTFGLAARVRAAAALEPAQQQTTLATPYSLAASVILFTAFVVGAFYALDALHGERRDRSILFWKSLPVSDRTAVLSKAAIPLLVLPLFAFAVALATQLVMLAWNGVVLALHGVSPTTLWGPVPLFRMTAVMAYGLAAHALWYAPLYAWFLLVSAWARRLPILWGLSPFALAMVERFTLGTTHLCGLMQYRLNGALVRGFDFQGHGHVLPAVHPLRFVATPGLWGGLIVAAAFLAIAVRLRRRREPI